MIRDSRDTDGPRLLGVDADQRRYRIQRIEKEVRINLAGQAFEARLHQQPLLFFQFGLGPAVVPDFQRERDAEISGYITQHQPRKRIPPAPQREKTTPVEAPQHLPEELGQNHPQAEIGMQKSAAQFAPGLESVPTSWEAGGLRA